MTSIAYVSSDTSVAASNASANDEKSTSESTLSEEKLIFLEILLTQLENQNPLDPVDTTEFTNQLVAYSSLEQEMEANQNLEMVVDALNSANTLSSVSYLGADVEIDTQASVMQNDEINWSYALADDAATVTLQIVDSDNNVLASYSSEDNTAGTYDISVSNEDLTTAVDEGSILYLVVVAVDDQGEEIETGVAGTVTVDSVESSGDEVTLTAGSMAFSLDEVVSLRLGKDNTIES